MSFDCVSNSSESRVGTITAPDGTMPSSDVIHPYNRPGVVRFRPSITASNQGIYTCTIPDSNDNYISLNVGLYLPGFNGELTSTVMVSNLSLSLNTEGPSISSLTYDEDSRTLTCVSIGSPPTRVVWMKDGLNLTTDRSSPHYSFSQTVTDRAASTYSNVLTVRQSAPGGVAGTYTCTVFNELNSDSRTEMAVGEFDEVYNLCTY